MDTRNKNHALRQVCSIAAVTIVLAVSSVVHADLELESFTQTSYTYTRSQLGEPPRLIIDVPSTGFLVDHVTITVQGGGIEVVGIASKYRGTSVGPGGNGASAESVTLTTTKLEEGEVTYRGGIEISGNIYLEGQHGGPGSDTNRIGGDGGDGGSLIVTSCADIVVYAGMYCSAGNGGAGDSGFGVGICEEGDAPPFTPGADGGNGGNAGVILLRQSNDAPRWTGIFVNAEVGLVGGHGGGGGAACQQEYNSCYSGADGGDGGYGGNGGQLEVEGNSICTNGGNCIITTGANGSGGEGGDLLRGMAGCLGLIHGGHGGDAPNVARSRGTVTFQTLYGGDIILQGTTITGNGKYGGGGGNGGTNFMEADCAVGGDGGDAGPGSAGANVLIWAYGAGRVWLEDCEFKVQGGDAGHAGCCGGPSFGEDCPQTYSTMGAVGHGGEGGDITIIGDRVCEIDSLFNCTGGVVGVDSCGISACLGGGVSTPGDDGSLSITGSQGCWGDDSELDVDVDSDNTQQSSDYAPDRTQGEDEIEDDPNYPGRYVAINNDDEDADGIPDWRDGFDLDGQEETLDDINEHESDFVRIEVTPPLGVSTWSTIKFEFLDNDGVAQPETVTLWAKPGNEARQESDRLLPGVEYDAATFRRVTGDGERFLLWAEGVVAGPRTCLKFTWRPFTLCSGASYYYDWVYLTTIDPTPLHTPYTGTIDSLRAGTRNMAYGETKNVAFPKDGELSSPALVKIWVETGTGLEAWDRSVLRLYGGFDGSGDEIDLTGCSSLANAASVTVEDTAWRFSLRSVATKTLAPKTFRVHVVNGSVHWETHDIVVEPMTAQYLGIAGEDQMFLDGVPMLHVSVGAAALTLRTGVRADEIGMAYIRRTRMTDDYIERFEVVLPDGAERSFLPHDDQFALTAGSDYDKSAYGTPCPGHQLGFHVGEDGWGGNPVYAPDGTRYDVSRWLEYPEIVPSYSSTTRERFAWLTKVCPRDVSSYHAACMQFEYDHLDGSYVTPLSKLVGISDGSGNSIALTRDDNGVVTGITTSDGRTWTIQSDDEKNITGIIPGDGVGARYFSYTSSANGRVRVHQLGLSKDANDNVTDVMYSFTYGNAGGDLSEEVHYIGDPDAPGTGTLQTVATHVYENSNRLRKDFFGTGTDEYRKTLLTYKTGQDSQLASVSTYPSAAGVGTAYTTTYNYFGSMKINAVETATLPDTTVLRYEYDHFNVQAQEPPVELGLVTKVTHEDGANSLVTLDQTYEFHHGASGAEILYYLPRVIESRDGRHGSGGFDTQVEYDYEDSGITNLLNSVSGPTITMGPAGAVPREPNTVYTYTGTNMLQYVYVTYASGDARTVEYQYDTLLRLHKEIVDPGGVASTTEYVHNDAVATQTLTVTDAENYKTVTEYNYSGQPRCVRSYLAAGSVADPCYQTEYVYNIAGRLYQKKVDNKDQLGAAIPNEPNEIVTQYTYDRLGRLTDTKVDVGGVEAEAHLRYNPLNEVEYEYDTSGRGVKREYNARGLVASETPLGSGKSVQTSLATSFTYDAVGRLKTTTRPSSANVELIYDGFGRVIDRIRHPEATGGGATITTNYEYDKASNVTRTYVDEDSTILLDQTEKYDEGGFNYESRTRTDAGNDDPNDPVTEREFDWAGNVRVVRSKGDATVGDQVITTIYDDAGRVWKVQDSEGGETKYTRDQRGSVELQEVLLVGTTYAQTNTEYDALGRVTKVTAPTDGDGLRHYRKYKYDSRGNLREETAYSSSDVPRSKTVMAYDGAGRLKQQATMADASSSAAPNVTTDRVVDFVYDTDGRVSHRYTYNAGSGTQLDTHTQYDIQGRVSKISDPATGYTLNSYNGSNGRLTGRGIIDGVGARVISYGYDGHDRVTSETALGIGLVPSFITSFELDGLDRTWRVTSPKSIKTKTEFDLVGRRKEVTEDEGGSLERTTTYKYNRLSQLISQTVPNTPPLADQVTDYRYTTLGQRKRTVYPDSTEDVDDPNCDDCEKQEYDLAGRRTGVTDQAGRTTTFVHDHRGKLLKRITPNATGPASVDTFTYDPLGRLARTGRGYVGDPNAVSFSERDYTDLGDLDYEDQQIAEGTRRRVDYGYDQAGNRTSLTYPGGAALVYTPTILGLVDTISLNGQEIVDYDYYEVAAGRPGRYLSSRLVTTDDAVAAVSYYVAHTYDVHRRRITLDLERVINSAAESLVQYDLGWDNHSNLTSQTVVDGDPGYANTGRTITVDDLDRITAVADDGYATAESFTLDLQSNRQSHTTRTGDTITYGDVNPANEYSTVGGQSVTYDDAGNLSVDEDGRQYFYDEFDRLTEVQTAASVSLVRYKYDALGRRIAAEFDPDDPNAAVTIRYYYDGVTVIEERDGSDTLTRYHVSGAQHLDEPIASFPAGGALRSGAAEYYLPGQNGSIIGTGNSAGVVTRVNVDAGGGFVDVTRYHHDSDADLDVDLRDLIHLQTCFDTDGVGCREIHDFDDSGQTDGDIDVDDWYGAEACQTTADVEADAGCATVPTPATGTFALHGRPVDVLSDGKMLYYFRARYYDPAHARWLQRDPTGYADGANLYEAFKNNAARFTDPMGKYTKLASGWGNGDEVVYQRFPWLWGSSYSSSYSVGRYFYYENQKLIVNDSIGEEYAYILPFEAVEAWSKGVHSRSEYYDFVRRYGTPFDPVTGKKVKRPSLDRLLSALDEAVNDAIDKATFDFSLVDPVVLFGGDPLTVMTGETATGALVSDSRTVTDTEYVLSLIGTASLGVGYWEVGSEALRIMRANMRMPAAPVFRTWNEFQAGTKGMFASRRLAADAWAAYKRARGLTGKVATSTNAGGRLGNAATRAQVAEIVTELRRRGWQITRGGGEFKEEYLPSMSGTQTGSNWVDITAIKDGKILRINTVDTLADGVTPTRREAAAAASIRAKASPGDHLLLVPKR